MDHENENEIVNLRLSTARKVLFRAGYRTPGLAATIGPDFDRETGFIRRFLIGMQRIPGTRLRPRQENDLERWENEGGSPPGVVGVERP